MGLDASVKCRCWEDGLCSPPTALAPRLWYDPATAEVNQTTPANLSAEEVLARDLEYDVWVMEGACTHPFMCIARERISNWGGLRAFKHALRSLGSASYTGLLREIPDGNGGLTTPADAGLCLVELDRFCATGPFNQAVELVDGTTGTVLQTRIGPYDGWLGTYGATDISHRLTADGSFQIERGKAGAAHHDPGAEILFRSKSFMQAASRVGEVRFTDLSSGNQHLCSDGIKDASGGYPTLIAVKQTEDRPDRYSYSWLRSSASFKPP